MLFALQASISFFRGSRKGSLVRVNVLQVRIRHCSPIVASIPTHPQCMAIARRALTSWNILTLSSGDECTLEVNGRGSYALLRARISGNRTSATLLNIPDREEGEVKPVETIADFPKRWTDVWSL